MKEVPENPGQAALASEDLNLAYEREQTVLNGKEMTHNNRSRLRPGASCFLRSTRRARPLLSGSEPRSSVGPPWSKVKTFYTSVNKERGTFQGALDEIVSRHTWYPTLFSGKKCEINYYNSYLNKRDVILLKTLSFWNYHFTNKYHLHKFSKKFFF